MDKDLRILILEDVPSDAELIEMELRKGDCPFVCRRVEKREDFLRGLDEFSPDLVLADYKLPAFDGLSALEIAKEKCPDIPFIFVTGAMGEEWAIETLKKGATDYVLKDRLSRLVPAVKRAMKEAEERSKRKKAEEGMERAVKALRVLGLCNEILVHTTDEPTFLKDICRIIVDVGGYRMAWVGYVQRDREKSVRPMVQAGYEEGYLEKAGITWADDERGRGPTGTAIRSAQIQVVKSISIDPTYQPWREAALKRGYNSSIALPLRGDGAVLGVLNIYAGEPDAFDDDEVKLLGEMADDLTYGIKYLRTEAERKKTDEELRSRVEELERFRNATIQREFRIKELKDKVKELEGKLEEATRSLSAK